MVTHRFSFLLRVLIVKIRAKSRCHHWCVKWTCRWWGRACRGWPRARAPRPAPGSSCRSPPRWTRPGGWGPRWTPGCSHCPCCSPSQTSSHCPGCPHCPRCHCPACPYIVRRKTLPAPSWMLTGACAGWLVGGGVHWPLPPTWHWWPLVELRVTDWVWAAWGEPGFAGFWWRECFSVSQPRCGAREPLGSRGVIIAPACSKTSEPGPESVSSVSLAAPAASHGSRAVSGMFLRLLASSITQDLDLFGRSAASPTRDIQTAERITSTLDSTTSSELIYVTEIYKYYSNTLKWVPG